MKAEFFKRDTEYFWNGVPRQGPVRYRRVQPETVSIADSSSSATPLIRTGSTDRHLSQLAHSSRFRISNNIKQEMPTNCTTKAADVLDTF